MKIRMASSREGNRPTCSSCGTILPSPCVEIEDAPAMLGCSEDPNPDHDRFLDFHVCVCSSCSLIQTDAVSDRMGYATVHSHAVGKVWEEHRDMVRDFIHKNIAERRCIVESALEIGPSVNPILKNMLMDQARIRYIDLMDKAPFDLTPDEHYEKQTFPSSSIHGTYDVIVASHVLEHADNIYAFMEAIKRLLTLNGVAILSVPNFYEWFRNKYWNSITSEHLNYPFIEQCRDLCFRLDLDAEFAYFKSHSLIMRVSRRLSKKPADRLFQECAPNNTRQMVHDWVIDIDSTITRYEEALKGTARKIFLAGASHLSQYAVLISDRIRSKVNAVLDNAPDKHNRRMYGTRCIVQPFTALIKIRDPLVLVPPSPYAHEMKKQVSELNARATIIS